MDVGRGEAELLGDAGDGVVFVAGENVGVQMGGVGECAGSTRAE